MDPVDENLASASADETFNSGLFESSFKLIAPHAEEFVWAFYEKLFVMYPEDFPLSDN
jgi:hypothetical protein